MFVGLNTTGAGRVSSDVTIKFASDGSGTSGLGITELPSQTFNVSGSVDATVFRLAQPSQHTPEPVNFGNIRIGASASRALAISNLSPNDGFSEKLNASISRESSDVTASGAFTLLNAGASNISSLQVGIDNSRAGAKSGTATIALASDGTGTSGLGITTLPSQTVNVLGNVYRLANGIVNTPTITLAARVGDANQTRSISVINSSPDAFTEGLKVTATTGSPGVTISGSINNLAAGETDNSSINVGISTLSAGVITASVGLNLISTGEGTTGESDMSIKTDNVAVNGKIYLAAAANVKNTVFDFGILHVGDLVGAKSVGVTNTATRGALNDLLVANLRSASEPFTALGTSAVVAAGETDVTSIQLGLDTTSAGRFSGSAELTLTSHNSDMADLELGQIEIDLKGQVNNFANPVFAFLNGTGRLTQSGDQTFVLDLGIVRKGGSAVATELSIINDMIGPVDLLDGTFRFDPGLDFEFAGFTAFTDLDGGDMFRGLLVSLDTNLLGTFEDILTLDSVGHNASGFRGDLPNFTLIVRGRVVDGTSVPEPGTIFLFVLGIFGVYVTGRKQFRARNQN